MLHGLFQAKRLMKKATKICCNFPETLKYLPEGKAVLTGSPIRQELLLGNKAAGLDLCNFTTDKPIILVVGGSTGAVHVRIFRLFTCVEKARWTNHSMELPAMSSSST